ncbi:sorbosone dehydrogenase [Flavilitoribacter nigricans DSM 23189 = NBRC 102662]|uniref:Sorbosone dehydrogenase n=2 Tax=Flavilitoribacter TaxID=2762562 RepID=A0A2D0NFM0_FLAN2|nr:sorbosone dehydrogenase [Flavilitoribacter nigricans DSM 23189 = NBRC 102662]
MLMAACSATQSDPDPVQRVISSMSDSFPLIAMPADADPESEDWKGIDLEPKAPVLPLYPAEEAKKFLLPPGYKIEPILTEPQIEQPGAIAFDGNGRMYVLELRTYMLTADSDGTLDPVSRISRWEDKDQDGVYETGTAFVDSLIFPRFVLPYGKDCVLTMESDADNIYKYTDTDGDGRADKKELFTTKYGRSGNVEHQQAFLYWGMDNWLYSTVNAFRVRESPGGVIREKTGYNRAQWGISHDDDGKLWFMGGASGVPSHFQFPIHYGNFEVEDQYAEGFRVPWGAAVKIADLQEGMDRVRHPDGSVNRVTGAAGNDIFRGDRLPEDLKGQLFYGEPVARIVRQINPVVEEGLTTLHNVYQDEKSEFLRSSDPLFRPVDMATAPDGTMYVVDMYHGIIQEGQWAQRGSYLRAKIEQYQLDKVVSLGRIWRITYDGMDRDKTRPNMLNETPAELVKHLEHPNGWWRDKAQQLLVLSRDQSVVPQLEKMARGSQNLLARFHALWSLEGLGALSADIVRELMQDASPRLRIQAMRAGETLYKKGDRSLEKDYQKMILDKHTDVVIQAMMSANLLELPGLESQIKTAMANNKAKGVQTIGDQILNPPVVRGFGVGSGQDLSETEIAMMEKGSEIFNELCTQCHGSDGTGTPMGQGMVMAPPLTGSSRVQSHPDYVIKVLLHGLTGAIEGKTYPGAIMVGMPEQTDEWIASIASFIRLNLTNEASLVTAEEVARVRSATAGQEGPYQYDALLASVPQVLIPQEGWKVTASHSASARIGGTASPKSAFNFEGWTTGEQQKEGMWFQVELPQATTLTEIHFTAPPIRRGWRPGSPPPIHTYPRAYEIQVSMDGKSWKQPVASGQCDEPDNIIAFQPVKARYLRITQTGSVEQEEEKAPWAMKELKLFGLAEPATM